MGADLFIKPLKVEGFLKNVMQGSRLREFNHNDLEDLKHLIDETVDASYSDYPEEFREHMKSDHHSRERILENARNGFTLIFDLGGRIVGTGTLLGTEIVGVFVHPSCQRKGFGKSIMLELEKRALTNGIVTLTLDSTPVSKGFYESLGYIIFNDALTARTNRKFTYYKMKKELKRS